MVDDIIVSAMEALTLQTRSREQVKGMSAMITMLCDFDELKWNDMNEEERAEWAARYIPKEEP